jgi:uncharacterized Zn-finger protein
VVANQVGMGIIRLVRRSTAPGLPGVRADMSVTAAIDPPEIVETDSRVVACDGGDGALGHPRVFLNIGVENFIDCPYCDKRFKLKAGARAEAGH